MQNDSKFLGICILVAAFILSGAIVMHGNSSNVTDSSSRPEESVGRYQFHPSNPPGIIWILDTTTGEVKTQSGLAQQVVKRHRVGLESGNQQPR